MRKHWMVECTMQVHAESAEEAENFAVYRAEELLNQFDESAGLVTILTGKAEYLPENDIRICCAVCDQE